MGILGYEKGVAGCINRPLRRSVLDVELVDGVELELDLLPGLEGDGQLGAVLRGFRKDVAALFLEMTAGVACLDAGLEGHTVGSSTCSGAPGVTVGTTTELKNGVVAEDGDQGGHVPHVDTAGSNGEHTRHGTPVLIEEVAAAAVFGHEGFAQLVDVAEGGLTITFQLADHGAGVELVTTRQTQTLGENAEVNAVLGMTVDHRVHCAVDVQEHAVLAAPLRQTGVGCEAPGDEVVHDDWHSEFFGELSALIHLLGSVGSHVEVVTLALTSLLLGQLDGFRNEFEAVLPTLEGLGVDVLVVLSEVQTATQALIDNTAVVLAAQTKLWLDGATQKRAAVLVHPVALDLDAVWRAVAALDKGHREADVFQTEVAKSLETKHVADQGGQNVGDRSLFEQVEGVSDEGVEGLLVTRDVLDAVATTFVEIEVGEELGPNSGPGAS